MAARLVAVLALVLLVVFDVTGQEELVLVGRVTKIVDGDTIDVLLEDDDETIRVRFGSIDAPERAQPGGKEATAALKRRLDRAQVELAVIEQDRYDRLVATVYLGGENINRRLVTQGHAWAYLAYLNDKGMVGLEGQARQERRGLWSRSQAIPPWEWRRGHRTQNKDYDDRDEFEPAGPDGVTENRQCGAKRYCADMASCEEAKFFLKMCGLSRLDGDGDGVPCDALCR